MPIAGVVGKTLTIANGTPTAGLFLRLGYSDDDYSENGYYSHDDGPRTSAAAPTVAWLK